MDKNRPNKDEIFNAAAEFADANERSAYLDQACGGSLTLRAEIEELLKHDLEEDSLLDRSAAGIGATLDQLPLERPGTQIGPYKLLQEIGEGGMGVVYLAEQTEPVRRRVALKLIKPGMDTRQVIARFDGRYDPANQSDGDLQLLRFVLRPVAEAGARVFQL